MIEIYFPPAARVDYCPVKNEIHMAHVDGKCLIDASRDFARKGWLKQLINFVIENGYNVDSGSGIPAFVRGLARNGHLSISRL
jgi:hypothetical protein